MLTKEILLVPADLTFIGFGPEIKYYVSLQVYAENIKGKPTGSVRAQWKINFIDYWQYYFNLLLFQLVYICKYIYLKYNYSFRLDGQWPEGLLAVNNTLQFSSPLTYNYTGTYVCKVTNALGVRSDQKTIYILGKSYFLAKTVC